MFNHFRHHPLRKGLWLIVLLGSLLTQTQSLFACDLMDSSPNTTCCCDENMNDGCPMGGGCDLSDSDILSGCCDVSTQVDVGLQNIVVSDSHQGKQVLTLDAPQPPPAILSTNELLFSISNASSALFVSSKSLSFLSPDTPLYRVTNRFRI